MVYLYERDKPKPGLRERLYILLLFSIGIAPFEINGIYNPLLKDKPTLFLLVDSASFVAIPLLLWAIGRKASLFDNRDLGFHFDIWGKKRADKFFAALLLLPPLAWLAYRTAYGYVEYDLLGGRSWKYFDYGQTFSPDASTFVRAFYYSITAAVTEEFYYRGLFRRVFPENFIGAALFVIISSLIFSSVHWEGGPANLAGSLAFGLVMAIAYVWTNNLWPLVLAHFISDMIAFWT